MIELVKQRADQHLEKATDGLSRNSYPYLGHISENLKPWHIYLEDAGHSILAILKEHEAEAFSSKRPVDFLIPIPVKTVMREFEVHDGFIIATSPELKYSPVFGLQMPEEDEDIEL